MQKQLIYLILICLGFGLAPLNSDARRATKIKVAEPLARELNSVLLHADGLHTACVKQNEQQIESSLKLLLTSIDRAKSRTKLAKAQQPHISKILNAAKQDLENSRLEEGESRKKSFKRAFKQLVQLVRAFKVDKYRVFFCPKDKSVWLQKGWKAKNPINPKRFGTCGKLVRS